MKVHCNTYKRVKQSTQNWEALITITVLAHCSVQKWFRCEVQIKNFTDFFQNSFLALCTGLKILVNWGESYFADCVLCVKFNLQNTIW